MPTVLSFKSFCNSVLSKGVVAGVWYVYNKKQFKHSPVSLLYYIP